MHKQHNEIFGAIDHMVLRIALYRQHVQEQCDHSSMLTQQTDQHLLATRDKLNATSAVLADLTQHIHHLQGLLHV
ncbi:MAG TPA: hypothetical protein VGD58_24750 [Herpetosiphonaceae bacterium]